MSEQTPMPRITAPYLNAFIGRHVTVVGSVIQLRGDQATLDSGGTITLVLNRDAHLVNGSAAHINGKVNPDLSIKVLNCKDLGNNVDLDLYASVVQATHQHKSIFAVDN
ncbi:replication factor A3 [Geosmithia morbida]|uniref:Replication factor A3 n=1 Tax=Geosmithia morbida TaxID=1094350 RepID=A0A9P5D2A2_9HYPO|nr:replication factor A3 [Geosmithia morbida]KAF4120620.1 replication factor A3 [Geosmithia morbida]